MVICWDCGMRFKSKTVNGEVQVYDTDNKCWTDECPNCGGFDFTDQDEMENDDYDGYDGYDY